MASASITPANGIRRRVKQPGNAHTEHQVEGGAERGVEEAVADAPGDGLLGAELGVVGEREGVGQDSEEPARGEGLDDDGEVRKHAEQDDGTGAKPEQEGLAGGGGDRGARGMATGQHGMAAPVHEPFGNHEQAEGEDHHEHHQGVAHGIGVQVGDGIVDLYGDHLGKNQRSEACRGR